MILGSPTPGVRSVGVTLSSVTVVQGAFDQQRQGYFSRLVVGTPDGPVDHPAAWRGADLAPERYTFSLTDEEIADLGDCADRLLAEGVPMSGVDAELASLPNLQSRLPGWREELRDGLGVVLLRGVPVRAWGTEKTSMAYWCLGHALGSPGPQNPAGELLGHVTDYRDGPEAGLVRLYRTSDDIRFHCDAADVVGLLALRTAERGGESRIASSTAIHNEIVQRRPDMAAELFEPFDYDRRDEEKPGDSPVFTVTPAAWDGRMLRVFWHSDYMRSAVRHDGVELSNRRQEFIDLFDAIGAEPEMRLDMQLDEGDIQLISNHTVVHSRTAYVDHVDPDERRHLLRLWLSL